MNTKENDNTVESTTQPRVSASPDGLGKALLGYLREKGLNQREFSAKVNIPAANLSAIVTGRRKCGIKLATRFSDALGLDGRERASFLNLVGVPRWKGFSNPEAILGNLLVQNVASSGIPINEIQSVVPLQKAADSGADGYIIMRNGEIIELEIKIRRKIR